MGFWGVTFTVHMSFISTSPFFYPVHSMTYVSFRLDPSHPSHHSSLRIQPSNPRWSDKQNVPLTHCQAAYLCHPSFSFVFDSPTSSNNGFDLGAVMLAQAALFYQVAQSRYL